jgi:hypothetical protein
MKNNNYPLDGYMRSIAQVNRIVFKEVLDNIQNQKDDGNS